MTLVCPCYHLFAGFPVEGHIFGGVCGVCKLIIYMTMGAVKRRNLRRTERAFVVEYQRKC